VTIPFSDGELPNSFVWGNYTLVLIATEQTVFNANYELLVAEI
jgi:hypothetical protein